MLRALTRSRRTLRGPALQARRCHLLSSVASLTERQATASAGGAAARVPLSLPAIAALENAPCLQCGRAKPAELLAQAARATTCAVSGLQLACSRECADRLESEQKELLVQLQSIAEDSVYSTGESAKRLFAEVLTATTSPLPSSSCIDSWEKYLQLYTQEAQWLADPRALRLVSAAYSFVMTLSHFLPALQLQKGDAARSELAIHVLGARAEAMMPRHFWEELRFFHPEVTKFDIKLIGDHVPALRKKQKQNHEQQQSRIHLENINGLYHDSHVSESIQSPPDAFVLFNPGIGHPFLKERWQPTMESLLASGKPILLSSFSKEDQERDVAVIKDLSVGGGETRFLVAPQLNPFRNLKYQIDPLNITAPIQTNSRVMAVQRKAEM